MPAIDHEWSKPAAMAIPSDGYFELQRGRYGPVFPRTPACYGFSIIAKVKPGREDAIRDYGKTIQAAIEALNRAMEIIPLRTLATPRGTSPLEQFAYRNHSSAEKFNPDHP